MLIPEARYSGVFCKMGLCDKASKLFLAASSLPGPALFIVTVGYDEHSIMKKKKLTVHQK